MSENKPSNPKKPQRGPKPNLSPAERASRALDNLQVATDRACKYVHDGPSAFAVYARRAAKRGIPEATTRAALKVLQDAVSDAEAVVAQAYAPAGGSDAGPTSRVNLRKVL